MPRIFPKNARVRRKANLRFRNFLFASSIICVFAIGLFLYLAFGPQYLRIAVSRAETADLKVIQTMARLLEGEHGRIRISPVVKDSATEVVESLRQAKADLAIARSAPEFGSEMQSVAVFRKNFVILWVANGSTNQKLKRVQKLQDFDGRAIRVVGQSTADQGVARLILSELGITPSKVELTPEMPEAERDRTTGIFMAISPVKSRSLATVIEETARERGELTFLGIDASAAVALKQPIFEAEELPAAVFKSSPAWPPEKIDTLSVNDNLPLLPRPALRGERVGVRGFLRIGTRGESPSPGLHSMQSDLSPQAGRGELTSAAKKENEPGSDFLRTGLS